MVQTNKSVNSGETPEKASIKTSISYLLCITSNALSNETEFEVKEDATKADIKKAFAKTLKKKMNKDIE